MDWGIYHYILDSFFCLYYTSTVSFSFSSGLATFTFTLGGRRLISGRYHCILLHISLLHIASYTSFLMGGCLITGDVGFLLISFSFSSLD